jgi:anti-sigma-K factor RskA
MTMERHATIGAMLDEYALGQLSQDERRDVERHVRECDLCAADLRELTVVMEGIAHSVEPVTPPPALRQRVIASLALQPQEPPRRASEASAVVTPLRRSDSSAATRRGMHPGWLAAAALVILGLGTALYSSINTRVLLVEDVQQAQAEAAAAQQTANELRRQLDLTAGQADLVVSILTADDMQPVPMAGRENATASVARAFWSPTRGLLIVANDLPTTPPGRIYQVWVISGAGPVSAGLLGGEQGSGRGILIAPPPSGLTPGAVTVAVTDEPPGGLPAPSGAIRLAGSI